MCSFSHRFQFLYVRFAETKVNSRFRFSSDSQKKWIYSKVDSDSHNESSGVFFKQFRLTNTHVKNIFVLFTFFEKFHSKLKRIQIKIVKISLKLHSWIRGQNEHTYVILYFRGKPYFHQSVIHTQFEITSIQNSVLSPTFDSFQRFYICVFCIIRNFFTVK